LRYANTQPTLLPNGRRIPALKLDQPRQLALMHSLAARSVGTGRGWPYDLWKLRAKGLVEKIPTPAATGFSHMAIKSAWCSWSSMKKFMLRWLPAFCSPLPPTSPSQKKRSRLSIVDILPSFNLVDAVGLKAA